MQKKPPRMTFDQTTRALNMWRGGADTLMIAQGLEVSEALVATQIAFLRDFCSELANPAPAQLAA
jgi:hypothetical protein